MSEDFINFKTKDQNFWKFKPISEEIGSKPHFGRLRLVDERNLEHPMRALSESTQVSVKFIKKERIWRSRWQGDQRNSSMCTAFSFLHLFEHFPITHARTYGRYKGFPYPIVDPQILYKEAQEIDPWPGNDYEGTSVLAMMQVAKARGFISEYAWEYKNVDTIVDAILNRGPVIVGTNWYRSMELKPHDANTQDAILLAEGQLVGGHAYLLDSANLTRNFKGREIGVFNSWGKDWGWSGRAFMSLDTLEKLLREEGEAVIVEEIK